MRCVKGATATLPMPCTQPSSSTGYTSLSQPEQQAQTQQQTLQQPNPEAQEQAGAAAPPTDTQQGQQQPQPQQQQAGGPDQAWGEEQGPPPDSDHVVLTDAVGGGGRGGGGAGRCCARLCLGKSCVRPSCCGCWGEWAWWADETRGQRSAVAASGLPDKPYARACAVTAAHAHACAWPQCVHTSYVSTAHTCIPYVKYVSVCVGLARSASRQACGSSRVTLRCPPHTACGIPSARYSWCASYFIG